MADSNIAMSRTESPASQSFHTVWVTEALRNMREIEVRAERITAGQPQAAVGVLNQLNALGKGLVLSADEKHPRWQELDQRYQAVRTPLVKIVVGADAARVAGQVTDRIRNLKAIDPANMKTEQETKEWRDFIAGAKAQQSKLSATDHPNVATLAARIKDLEDLLEEKIATEPPKQVAIWAAS